jgi:chemotaxis signal transduction protein
VSASADEGDPSDWIRLLPLRVGDDWYAVESGRVDGVLVPETVTRVPHTGAAVAGVARLRGETTVVVDGHELLDAPATGGERRTVVFRRGPDETPVALAVDEVGEVETYPAGDVGGAADPDGPVAAVVDREGGALSVLGVDRIAERAAAAGRP